MTDAIQLTEHEQDSAELFLSRVIQSALAPPNDLPADEWIEQNVFLGGDSDMPGQVNFDLIPMARFFLRACQNPRVRKVTAVVGAQSAKTKTCEFFLIWKIRNRPAPTIWYSDTPESAKTISQTRLAVDFLNCEQIAGDMPVDRDKSKWWLIQFAAMDLYVLGVTTKRNLERISAETVICDERRNYPPGSMQRIRNRYKTFRNYKEISISVAGIEGDDLDCAFNSGSRHMFQWACPHCGHRQTFRFGRKASSLYRAEREHGGLIWDVNEITRPAEHVWNTTAVRKTVRYQCENSACLHEFKNWDKPRLMRTIEPVQTNPMAPSDEISMQWWDAYMPWEQSSFENIVEQFLLATSAMHARGDIEPLKVVTQEIFGEAWREITEGAEVKDLEARVGDYLLGEEWPGPEKMAKILTVDVQAGKLVYVLRQIKINGAKRLLRCGYVLGHEELRKIQTDNGVIDKAVYLDSIYRPSEVGQWCLKYGWRALLGDNAKEFTVSVSDGRETKAVKQYWKAQDWNVAQGIKMAGLHVLKRYNFCLDHYREQLYLIILKAGMGEWSIAKNTPQKYSDEVQRGHERIKRIGPKGEIEYEWVEHKPNDFADCEIFQLVVEDIWAAYRQTR